MVKFLQFIKYKFESERMGKFENYFQLFCAKVLPWIHSKKTIVELFKIKSAEEQKEFYKEMVATDCNKKYDEIYREVLLDVDKMEVITYDTTRVIVNNVEVKVGDDIGLVININPIYFDFDKFDIRPDAAVELDKIIKIMNDHPTMEIELGSHTDCRGKMVYNDWLSQQRATSSANYIKERLKVNPLRIYGKGYGERKLKENCPCEGKGEKKQAAKFTEAQHQLNRRTEFVIIKLK